MEIPCPRRVCEKLVPLPLPREQWAVEDDTERVGIKPIRQ